MWASSFSNWSESTADVYEETFRENSVRSYDVWTCADLTVVYLSDASRPGSSFNRKTSSHSLAFTSSLVSRPRSLCSTSTLVQDRSEKDDRNRSFLFSTSSVRANSTQYTYHSSPVYTHVDVGPLPTGRRRGGGAETRPPVYTNSLPQIKTDC